jgi:hypothetical protein
MDVGRGPLRKSPQNANVDKLDIDPMVVGIVPIVHINSKKQKMRYNQRGTEALEGKMKKRTGD